MKNIHPKGEFTTKRGYHTERNLKRRTSIPKTRHTKKQRGPKREGIHNNRGCPEKEGRDHPVNKVTQKNP
jgi:hypothetical protein